MRFLRNILILLILSACSLQEIDTSHSFRTYEEDGVQVAVTSGGPMYDEPPFRLEYILSVEQSEQTPTSLLKDPDDFVPGPDRTLIVVEPWEGRAVVYNIDGRFIREIGGQGAGPGQFKQMTNLSVVGDSLFFYDKLLVRITSLGVDGSLFSVSSVRDYGQQGAIEYLPGGLLAISDGSLHFENNLVYESIQLSVIRFTTGDTLASLATGHVLVGDQIDSRMASRRPFWGFAVARVIGNQMLLLSRGDRPIIDLFDIQGQALKSIRLDIPPRQVTQSLRDVYWADSDVKRTQIGRRPLDPSYKAQQIFPKRAGWWRSAIADDVGYLWLEDAVSNPARSMYQPCRFFVIDPDGRFLGDVELPSSNGRIQAGLYYTLIRNLETDAIEPTIYRIVSNRVGLEYP